MNNLPRALSVVAAVAIAGVSPLARAQTSLTVSANGASYATGTYTANMYLNTCNDTQTTDSISGDPAQIQLQWSVPANTASTQIFGDTSSDCNTGLAEENPDSGVAIDTTDGTETTITPEACTSDSTCGAGVGNVTINLRTVMSQALMTLVPGVVFDGGAGGPCYPNESPGPYYICIVETVNESSSLSTSQESEFWYMAVNFDTFPPPAPSDVTGAVGDENIIVSWDYSSATLLPDHYLVYYQPDPTPGMTADVNGNCSVDASANARKRLHKHGAPNGGYDGGCDDTMACCGDVDFTATCCGDAGVDDGGNCFPDAGGGIATTNDPGVCDGCQISTDCVSGDCLQDPNGNTYCATQCEVADNLPDGGSLDCPADFNCVAAPSGITPFVCEPADQGCRPAASECGVCMDNTDCAAFGAAACAMPADGGPTFCVVECLLPDAGTDAGANTNGSGECLGDSVCEVLTAANLSGGTACVLPSQSCYDPTLLAVVFDGGDQFINPDAGQTTDAGAGGSGIDVTGWSQISVPSSNSNAQVDGLTNGICYDFVVQTVLSDGTQGELSSEVINAPVKNYDFWRLYQSSCDADAGQCDQGGWHCQSGGGAVGILAVMAGMLAVAARRRRPNA